MYNPKATDIFAVGWICMACEFLWFAFMEMRDTLKIDRSRGFSMGVVDNAEYCKGENGDHFRYELKYLDSSGYHYFIFKNIEVGKKQLQLSDSLGVFYYTDNPDKAYFAGDFESHYGFVYFILVGLINAGVGMFLFRYLRRVNFDRVETN